MKEKLHSLQATILFSLSLILFSCLGGCRKTDRLQPFGWEKTDPTTDSLTLAIENELFRRGDTDTLSLLINLLDRQAVGKRVRKERADFFRSALYELLDRKEEADSLLHHLIASTDSSSNPYLYNRLRNRLDEDNVSPADYYRILRRRDFFREVGDSFFTAALDIDLGNLLKNCNDIDGAMQAYSEADSLLRKIGYQELALPIGINEAHALQIKGDSAGGEALLRKLLLDPVIADNYNYNVIILRNLVSSTGDRRAALSLKKLYEEWDENPEEDAVLSLFFSEEAFDSGDYNEALRLARAGYYQALKEGDDDVKAKSMQRITDAFSGLGNIDSAYYYLLHETLLTDSIELSRMPEEIKATETARIIANRKMEREIAVGKKMLWIATSLFFVFLCVIVMVAIVVWRLHRLRLSRAQASLEMEKAHRRLLATQILVEEKDALLSSLSKDLSQLEEKGEITSEMKGHISTPIKTHIVQKSNRGAFLDTFSELHPEFGERLRSRSSELTDTDIRLAKYIVVGLDNKQIASTLGIRPESVKQARWRLRSKLQLPSGSSLEAYLQDVLGK